MVSSVLTSSLDDALNGEQRERHLVTKSVIGRMTKSCIVRRRGDFCSGRTLLLLRKDSNVEKVRRPARALLKNVRAFLRISRTLLVADVLHH